MRRGGEQRYGEKDSRKYGTMRNGEVVKQKVSRQKAMITKTLKHGTIIMDDDCADMLRSAVIKRDTRSGRVRVVHVHYVCGTTLKFNTPRVIMNAPYGMVVDHINHNTLDNRRSNLRVCTGFQNARNNLGRKIKKKCIFKGVAWANKRKYKPNSNHVKDWRAYTRINGKRVWFGYYESEQKAAMAYNANVYKLFGEYACYNRFQSCPIIETMIQSFSLSGG